MAALRASAVDEVRLRVSRSARHAVYLVVVIVSDISRILLVRIVLVFMVPEGVAQMLRRLASSEV